MQPTSPKVLGALLAALLFSGVALAQSQDPAGQATPQNPSEQTQAPQSTPEDPNGGPAPLPPPAQPKPPPPEAKKKGDPGSDTPIASPDTVKPKNSKQDVDAVGNRGVGKGINFYSIEREIGLGKQLAQEVERSSKLIYDPIVTEYVNRAGQNLVRNSDAKLPFTITVIDSDEVTAFSLPGGFFYVNNL